MEPEVVENEAIGRKIASLRKEHGYSQRELADKASMTNSAISSIENGKVSPSVSSLQKIVNVFSMSLSDFFVSAQSEEQDIKVVVSADELVEMGTDSVSYKLVSNGDKNRKLGFLVEEYQPHSSTGHKEISHEGEEAGIVLQGEIELEYGGETYHIGEGEAYVIYTNVPHKFTNKSDQVCKIVSAHTPPTF